MGKNNTSPGKQRFTLVQYARGATRSLQVGLKMVKTLNMEPERAIEFLEVLSAVLQDQFAEFPTNPRLRIPFLDKCANEALHRMNKG